MDINYYKKYEPIDGKWYITKELGSGAFGKVFEIERRDFTNDKSALKIITIPSDPNEVRSYREENYDLDEQSVSSYFYGFVEDFTKEFALMTQLKGQNNVVRIEDYDIKVHEGEVGWDIFIRMELLTPMNKYFAKNSPKTRDVIKLGIDICKALEVCQKFNIVHRDIKPSNIFVSATGEFKLGDFGVARTLEKTSSGLSKKGTYTYMAPEVYKGEAYGSNVDSYSLGIVMYKLLNNNMEPYKQGRTHEDDEKALVARLKGEPMAKPANAEGRLAEIILKACSFNPKDRYESPLQMRSELESILYSEEEEKIIHPGGEELDFEPSDVPDDDEPDTMGLFDEAPETETTDEEDRETFGLFGGKKANDSGNETEESFDEKDTPDSEPVDTKDEENNVKEKAKKKLPWKGIMAVCGAILVVIIGTVLSTSNYTVNNDNSSPDNTVMSDVVVQEQQEEAPVAEPVEQEKSVESNETTVQKATTTNQPAVKKCNVCGSTAHAKHPTCAVCGSTEHTEHVEYLYHANGNVSSKNEYDSQGELVQITHYNEDGTFNFRERIMDRSSAGHVARINYYDAAGSLTSYETSEFDSWGYEIRRNSYNADGTLLFYRIIEFDENHKWIRDTTYNGDGTPIY